MFCPKCGAQNEEDAKFCEKCGARHPAINLECSQCGRPIFGEQLCPDCGSADRIVSTRPRASQIIQKPENRSVKKISQPTRTKSSGKFINKKERIVIGIIVTGLCLIAFGIVIGIAQGFVIETSSNLGTGPWGVQVIEQRGDFNLTAVIPLAVGLVCFIVGIVLNLMKDRFVRQN